MPVDYYPPGGGSDASKMPLSGGTFTGSVVAAGFQFTGSGVGRVLGNTGSAAFDFGGSAGTINYSHIPLAFPAASRVSVSTGQIHSNNTSGQIGLDAATGQDAFLAVNGTKKARATAAGLVCNVLVADEVSLIADGAWHNLYDLSAGVHVGQIILNYSDTTPTRISWVWYNLANTSITYESIQTGWTGVFVNAGSAANGNIALQVSGGFVQYKCGIDFTNSPKLGVRFEGKIV